MYLRERRCVFIVEPRLTLLRPIFFVLEKDPYIFSLKKETVNAVTHLYRQRSYILKSQTVDSFITSHREYGHFVLKPRAVLFSLQIQVS